MGLETHTSNGLALAKWQKNYSHSQQNHWKCLWPSAVCRGAFYYATAMKPGCRRTHSGTQELLSYIGVCAILICRKFPNTVSQILQVALSIENKWCGKIQISICPQKLQHLDQYLMKPGQLDSDMQKICAKLVPKILTNEQKENRRNVCLDLLERIENDKNVFKHAITGDETWIFEYDPDTKRRSSEWHTCNSPRPKKARMSKSKIC